MATSVRTDEHREGVLVPANYRFCEVLDLYAGGPKDDVIALAKQAAVPPRWLRFVERQRARVAGYQARSVGERSRLSQCNICGAHIRYAVVWAYHPEPGGHFAGYITTGTDCASSVNAALESEIASQAGALREFVAGMRKQARKAAASHTEPAVPAEAATRWSAVDRRRQAWVRASEANRRVAHFLHAVSGYHADMGCTGKCFFCDVTADLVETGSLSERQVDAVLRSVPAWETHGRIPEPQFEVPSGVTTITGTLTSAKNGHMLIKCKGYRVWTIPPEGLRAAQSGSQVRFTAHVEPSTKDPKFLIARDVRDGEVVG
jgi:hypothetical protein